MSPQYTEGTAVVKPLRLVADGVSISNNTAEQAFGGGISSSQHGMLDLRRLVGSGNRALRGSGGFIAAWGSNVTLSDANITGNAAGQAGGGIFVSEGSLMTLTDSRVLLNEATQGGGIHVGTGTQAIVGSLQEGNSDSVGEGQGVADDRMMATRREGERR
eukprot:gene18309-21829_t